MAPKWWDVFCLAMPVISLLLHTLYLQSCWPLCAFSYHVKFSLFVIHSPHSSLFLTYCIISILFLDSTQHPFISCSKFLICELICVVLDFSCILFLLNYVMFCLDICGVSMCTWNFINHLCSFLGVWLFGLFVHLHRLVVYVSGC